MGIHKFKASKKFSGIEENYNCQIRGRGRKQLLAAMRRRDPNDDGESGSIKYHCYTKERNNDHDGQEDVYQLSM